MIIFLAGCWDHINIEERGFVIGTAVDKAVEDSNEHINVALTNQIVSPAGLGTPTSDSSDETPYVNLTTIGESLFAINRQMLKKTSRIPFYEHLRLAIVSEEVAHDAELFASLMDVFMRDQEMRRGIKIMIAEDKAKNVLEVDPDPEKLPVMHIDMITENAYKSMDMIKPVTLGNLHSFLLNDSSYVLPKITVLEDKVDYNGVAVFHGSNDKMVGSLNSHETKGMNLIKGGIKGGMIKFKVEDHIMAFDIDDAKSQMEIDTNNPKSMDIYITIETEGKLAEMYGSKTLLNPSYLEKMEEKVAERIEELANQTIEKAQNELKLDILDIGKVLKRKHYSTWKKVEKDWEEGENYFANSRIHVSADVKVRETGATDRAKKREHE